MSKHNKMYDYKVNNKKFKNIIKLEIREFLYNVYYTGGYNQSNIMTIDILFSLLWNQ